MIKLKFAVLALLTFSLASCKPSDQPVPPPIASEFKAKSEDGMLTVEERKSMSKEQLENFGNEQIQKTMDLRKQQQDMLDSNKQ